MEQTDCSPDIVLDLKWACSHMSNYFHCHLYYPYLLLLWLFYYFVNFIWNNYSTINICLASHISPPKRTGCCPCPNLPWVLVAHYTYNFFYFILDCVISHFQSSHPYFPLPPWLPHPFSGFFFRYSNLPTSGNYYSGLLIILNFHPSTICNGDFSSQEPEFWNLRHPQALH